MNQTSLAHYNTKKQIESSWIDDPFDMKGLVTGVTPLSHERNLNDYALELVSHYADYSCGQYNLTLDMLPDDEKNELARLYIESIDREIEWACYGTDESINSDFLCAMLSMLKNDCDETRENFSDTTRKNLIIYYTKQLEEVLTSACDQFQDDIIDHSNDDYEEEDY